MWRLDSEFGTGLTDLKETFKLKGGADLSFFKVEIHHLSFDLAASAS